MANANKTRYREWTCQPQVMVPIRRNHWSTEGLVSAILPAIGGAFLDTTDVMTRGVLKSNTGGIINMLPTIGSLGFGKTYGTAINNYLWTDQVPVNWHNGFTAYVWVIPIETLPGAQRAFFSFGRSSVSTNPLVRFQQMNTTGFTNLFLRNDAATNANFSNAIAMTAGVLHSCAAYSNGSNLHGFRVNGVDTTNTTSISSPTTVDRYAVGIDLRATTSNQGNQHQLWPLIYDRMHSSAQIDSILANPWQIFEPRPLRLIRPALPTGGGSGILIRGVKTLTGGMNEMTGGMQ